MTAAKGLGAGSVSTLSGAVLGIAAVAPGYTLTASIGLIVAAVGVKMPAIFICGFIPMLLTAFAYRELNNDGPDAGASITWSTKAFGPYAGWMCGWGMLIATILVLSNLTAVAVQFCYLLLAALFGDAGISDLPANKGANIATTVLFIAVAAWVSSRGIQTSQVVQMALVCFQLAMILGFAAAALAAVARGHAPVHLRFGLDWFNPLRGLATGALVMGVTGSVFTFWGWDTCLTLAEEAKDPKNGPGRAAVLCLVTILLTYLLVSLAAMLYAGVGRRGPALGNPHNSPNVFATLAQPVLGARGGDLLFLAILASSAASLQTTFLPAARCMLAMGTYRAFPKRFAQVSGGSQQPVFSTVVAGLASAGLYSVVTLLSRRTLADTTACLGRDPRFFDGQTLTQSTPVHAGDTPVGRRNDAAGTGPKKLVAGTAGGDRHVGEENVPQHHRR